MKKVKIILSPDPDLFEKKLESFLNTIKDYTLKFSYGDSCFMALITYNDNNSTDRTTIGGENHRCPPQ